MASTQGLDECLIDPVIFFKNLNARLDPSEAGFLLGPFSDSSSWRYALSAFDGNQPSLIEQARIYRARDGDTTTSVPDLQAKAGEAIFERGYVPKSAWPKRPDGSYNRLMVKFQEEIALTNGEKISKGSSLEFYRSKQGQFLRATRKDASGFFSIYGPISSLLPDQAFFKDFSCP